MQVGAEAQDVGLAVVQAFQQHPAGTLFLVRAGHAADLRQADADARCGTAAGQRRYLGGDGSAGPGSRAVFAAWMRARSASAIWPGQIASGYVLGRVLEITEEVRRAELVHDTGEAS